MYTEKFYMQDLWNNAIHIESNNVLIFKKNIILAKN